MTPERWREIVGEKVEARRVSRGFRSVRSAARAASINEATWRQVESGRRQVAPGHVIAPSPSEGTAEKMAVALAWDRSWLADLLAGREPGFPDDLTQYIEARAAWGFDRHTPAPTWDAFKRWLQITNETEQSSVEVNNQSGESAAIARLIEENAQLRLKIDEIEAILERLLGDEATREPGALAERQ